MLILVVGPSGAGKDTLLDAARARLEGDARFRFARRVITRPVQPGGEQHEAVSHEEFAARRFVLQWNAHGVSYGIPDDVDRDLETGRAVVASVSRTVITDAAERYRPVRVIEVTAPPEVLAERLAARGRESTDDIAQRLARTVPLPGTVSIETVMNDASREEGAARFLAALSRAVQAAPR
jgi:phosphonate metabolism protein PhnN/1,5-bisphosphokinase (PRPP-forming)